MKIDFIVGETTAPLILALAVATVLGMIVGYIAALLHRGNDHD